MKHELTPHWEVEREEGGLPRVEGTPILRVEHGLVHLDPMHVRWRGRARVPVEEWNRTPAQAVERALARQREAVARARRGVEKEEAYEAALLLLLERSKRRGTR